MNPQFAYTTIVTFALAVIGYLAKYINDLRLAKRAEKLNRVNRQLKELYGPLLGLLSSTLAAFDFQKIHDSCCSISAYIGKKRLFRILCINKLSKRNK